MKFDRNSLLLYAVTDRKWTSPQVSLYDQVCAAIDGGVSCVQLREKQLDESDFLAQARLIGKLCRARRVPFIINDNVELALRCQADGVHIGQDDMDAQQVRKRIGEQMILGVSAHNVEEARTAFQNGADYLGAGAVFSTSTKNNVTTLPLDTLREICSSVELPVVTIGGIDRSNILKLKGTGVAGVAVVSAIFSQPDPCQAARELVALSRQIIP